MIHEDPPKCGRSQSRSRAGDAVIVLHVHKEAPVIGPSTCPFPLHPFLYGLFEAWQLPGAREGTARRRRTGDEEAGIFFRGTSRVPRKLHDK